jgi:hypothetical protein
VHLQKPTVRRHVLLSLKKGHATLQAFWLVRARLKARVELRGVAPRGVAPRGVTPRSPREDGVNKPSVQPRGPRRRINETIAPPVKPTTTRPTRSSGLPTRPTPPRPTPPRPRVINDSGMGRGLQKGPHKEIQDMTPGELAAAQAQNKAMMKMRRQNDMRSGGQFRPVPEQSPRNTRAMAAKKAQEMARMQQSKNMAAKKAQEMERFRGGARPVPRPDTFVPVSRVRAPDGPQVNVLPGGARPVPRPDTHVPVSRVRAPDGPQVNKDEGYRDDIRYDFVLPLPPAGNSRPVPRPVTTRVAPQTAGQRAAPQAAGQRAAPQAAAMSRRLAAAPQTAAPQTAAPQTAAPQAAAPQAATPPAAAPQTAAPQAVGLMRKGGVVKKKKKKK